MKEAGAPGLVKEHKKKKKKREEKREENGEGLHISSPEKPH
jgi:hypothetical protein